MTLDIIRRVRFAPYRRGMGPTFALTLWDTHRTERNGAFGKAILGYRLAMRGKGRSAVVLFQGEDFACSPVDAIDSDATVAALMGFLTLRPGDTDRDYFANYTPEQLDYCAQHAEALACEVACRFGDDGGAA